MSYNSTDRIDSRAITYLVIAIIQGMFVWILLDSGRFSISIGDRTKVILQTEHHMMFLCIEGLLCVGACFFAIAAIVRFLKVQPRERAGRR